MTVKINEASFLGFGCALLEYVATIEFNYRPFDRETGLTLAEPGDQIGLQDAYWRHEELLADYISGEIGRLKSADVKLTPSLRAYAGQIARTRLTSYLAMCGDRDRPSKRDVEVKLMVGTHLAFGKNRVGTCTMLNRGLLRSKDGGYVVHYRIRNALITFVKRGGVRDGVLDHVVAEAMITATAVDKLWEDFEKQGRPHEVLRTLIAVGELLPKYRAAMAQAAKSYHQLSPASLSVLVHYFEFLASRSRPVVARGGGDGGATRATLSA